tara:strand:+ start:253 stop:825 length:573 start_codon:yes stop_codon:yes gene_type:complete
MATYLITSEEIRLNTPMGGNVDSDKFVNFINDVQVLVLENVLGTKLFNKIITDFNAGNLTGLYLQMFTDYIKPVLWHSVFAEYVKIGSIIVGNGGMYKHVAENAEVASMEDINYIAKNAQSKADTYIDRLIRFLCDQDSNIAEYTTNQDEDYDIDPTKALQTISGWFLTGDAYQYPPAKYDKDDWRIDEN